MSLATLAEVTIDSPGVQANMSKPRMEWLPIDVLRINTAYQRSIVARGLKNIQRIARNFNWNRFSPVIVTAAGDGLFEIIDGQHRTIAARECGLPKVPCYIVQCSESEAPRIFAAVNGDVTPMQPLYVYKAALAACEGWAVELKRVCNAAGIDPCVHPIPKSRMKPGHTLAITTIRKHIEKMGAEHVERRLKALSQHPEFSTPGFVTRRTIDEAVQRAVYRPPTQEPAPTASSIDDKIRELSRRGNSRGAIAAMLRVPYAKVEEALQ